MKKVHFIGIGGTGISAIALMLLEKGYQVSGSDVSDSIYFNAVTRQGAKTILGHDPQLAIQADLVVRSSAIRDNDPEVLAARKAGIPVLKRADFLPELTAGKQTLAIAGSHGKTTTTGILVCLLESLNLDPSFILGAGIKSLGTNAKTGQGAYFVIEADEYDYMFLGLTPAISVITNIEHDHPDCFPTPECYRNAFQSFLERTKSDGAAIVCGDDPGVVNLLETLPKNPVPLFTYGFSERCNYQISNWSWSGNSYDFSLAFTPTGEIRTELGKFRMPLPGKHNLSNAAAALAVIHQLGFNLSEATKGLASYSGTDRRFDILANQDGIVVINDYGHHPTQIKATLQAARELFPTKTLWAIWEPHTYSRTQKMQTEFVNSLNLADRILITRIYAAREDDSGVTPEAIAQKLPDKKGLYLPDFEAIVDYLVNQIRKNDVIIVLSAGKGPEISASLIDRLINRSNSSMKEQQI